MSRDALLLASGAVAIVLMARAATASGPALSLRPVEDPACARPFVVPLEPVLVQLHLSDLGGQPASGYQAFVHFDPAQFAFTNGTYTAAPFGLPVTAITEGPPGRIRLAAGVNPFSGQLPTTADALLATLHFMPLVETCDARVEFDTSGQANMVANPSGTAIVPLALESTDAIRLDGTPPVIASCCPPQSLAANPSCLALVPDLRGCVSAADGCGGALAVVQQPAPGTLIGLGTTWVTLTVSDCAGNFAFCQTAVTVADTVPPTILTCPGDRTLKADGDCEARVPDLRGAVTASDACDSQLTIVQNPPADATIGGGTTVVTLTVTDNFGNSSACTVDVNVLDSTPPMIAICPNDRVLTAAAGCTVVLPDLRAGLLAVDNCTIGALLTVSQSPAPGTILPLSPPGAGVVVTLTVTDQAGLSDQCTVRVDVVDALPPVIASCPADVTIPAGADCRALVPDLRSGVVATDQCPGPLTITQSPPPGAEIVGAVTVGVTLTVADGSGNTATCTVNVRTLDTTPPTIQQCSPGLTIPVGPGCQALVPQLTGGVVASDGCGGTLVTTQVPPAGQSIGRGTSSVTITVTDAAGNSSTCTASVLVTDAAPPVIECPPNLSVECTGPAGAPVAFTASAHDGCDGSRPVECFRVDGAMNVLGPLVSGDTLPRGRTSVVCRAADGAGNQAQCLFTITVGDSVAPTITTCPSPRTLALGAACRGTVPDLRGEAAAIDLCDPAPVISQTPAPGSIFVGSGTLLATVTATDASGNGSSCKVPITFVDDRPPVITSCSAPIIMKADGLCRAQVPNFLPGVSAVDECPGPVHLAQSPAPGTIVSPGVTVITFTATDAAGRSTSCSRDLLVIDASDPVILGCSGPLTLAAGPSCTTPVPDLRSSLLATDNCTAPAALTVVQQPLPGMAAPLGNTLVLITVTDGGGNSSECSVPLTVFDGAAPFISCRPDVTVTAGLDTCTAPAAPGQATATDACDTLVKVSGTRSDGLGLGAAYPAGVTTITWTAIDDAGNAASCTQRVTVVDQAPPLMTCPGNVSVYAEAGRCAAQVTLGPVAVADACDANVTLHAARGDGLSLDEPYPVGTTSITWSAADDSGNVSTCSATVEVDSMSLLEVDIDLPYTVNPAAHSRCITFEVHDCDEGAIVAIERTVTFVGGSARNVLVEVPCDLEIRCVMARDRLHTLPAVDDAVTVGGGRFAADFTGPRSLVAGDLNADDRIDILDFAIFASAFLSLPGAGSACGGPWDPHELPHADISGNGLVFVEDFAFISVNFGMKGESPCCGGAAGSGDQVASRR